VQFQVPDARKLAYLPGNTPEMFQEVIGVRGLKIHPYNSSNH
jgi:hypothetical protein